MHGARPPRCSSTTEGSGSDPATFGGSSSRARRRRCTRTRCATPTPRTCSRVARTSASSKSCSATRISRRPRCTRTSPKSASNACTARRTQGAERNTRCELRWEAGGVRTIEIDIDDDDAFARWYAPIHTSDRMLWPDEPGWLPHELHAFTGLSDAAWVLTAVEDAAGTVVGSALTRVPT